jgi:putative alpha-1,2-mannosidase
LKLASKNLEIEVVRPTEKARFIDKIVIDGKRYNSYRISHDDLMKAGKVVFYLKEKK